MKEMIKQAFCKQIIDNISLKSGKFFDKDGVEIKDIKKHIANLILVKNNMIILDNDLNSIVNTIYNYGTNEEWLELPIVKEAKKLGSCNDKMAFELDDKQLTIINRMLFHPNDEVMFITTGIGGSGKSTFLNIVKQIFDNDYSSASLSDLSNPFTVAEAVKHRLICSDELAKGELNLPILKQLVSKQNMFVAPKHISGYEVKTQSALFYCCNKAPKIDVLDTGILRRIVFYERNTKIKKPNVLLNGRIYTYEELLTIVRNSLRFENDKWFNLFSEETHKYLMKDNSVYLFWFCNTYESYADVCRGKGMKPYSEPNYKEIRELFEEWIREDTRLQLKQKPIDISDFI